MYLNAKNYNKLNELEQQIYESKANVQLLMTEKNYEEIVAELIHLKEMGLEIKNQKHEGESIESKSHRDIWYNDTERFIVDTVSDISKDVSELLKFAYELRKQDAEDKYSYDILNGQVSPQILVDIFMNNKWDEEEQRMVLVKEQNYRFIINVGKNRFTLCYLNSK